MTLSFKRDPISHVITYTVTLRCYGMTFVGNGLSLKTAKRQAYTAAREAAQYCGEAA